MEIRRRGTRYHLATNHKIGRDEGERQRSVRTIEGNLLAATECGVMIELAQDAVDLSDGVLGALHDLHICVILANLQQHVFENYATLIVNSITQFTDLPATLQLTPFDNPQHLLGGDLLSGTFRILEVVLLIGRLLLTDTTVGSRKPEFDYKNVAVFQTQLAHESIE